MACTKPLKALQWVGPGPKIRDKKLIILPHRWLEYPSYESYKKTLIPCGQCMGCRLNHSREWAIRCVHEASIHDANSFLTLTYNDQNLTNNKSKTLNKRDWQLFAKKLRNNVGPFRFYMCGEYGSKNCRPHYHACVFGFDFPDKYVAMTKTGTVLYRSPLLETLWDKGFSTIGDLTFDSAAYVARYVTKKITGDQSYAHYKGRLPEFVQMSRRPGIAKSWIEQYIGDVYPHDYLIIRDGIKCKPPRYYDQMYDQISPEAMKGVKEAREDTAMRFPEESSRPRLTVKEQIHQLKLGKLKRPIEQAEKYEDLGFLD